MTTAKVERSIRLSGKPALELDRISGTPGEIFLDSTGQTLRVYNGATIGGTKLATVSALNSLIPSQTSNSGKYLTTNGTAATWGTITPTPVATRTSTGTVTGLVGNEIALGINSGKTSQGAYAVALGLSAGEVSQATLAVAVGATSGLTNQQMAAVAIGYQAGQTAQGASAIAIGRAAGKTNQAANSIVINATGSTLNNTTSDSLVIAPIRSATATANVLYYDTTSKEVTYAALPLEIPTQTGNSGKYLTTNGTTVSWGTVTATVTATDVGLGNVTNESKATMFASPTFTGTVAAFSSATHTLTGSSNLVFTGSTSGTVTLRAGTTPAVQTYTLPAAYPGVNGYALTSTTAGVLSWAAAGGGGGTTTNALTFSTGLSLNSGTTFDGSAARTVTLATSGVTAQTVGGSTTIPVITVDSYGRITSISTATPSGGSSSASFATIYPNAQGPLSSPVGGSTILTASSSVDTLYLIAGTNITITAASSPSKAIMISSSGGAAAGITWTGNTSSGGNITVTNPTGYSTSGSTLVIVVVGLSVSSTSASSSSASFSTGISPASQTRVFYTPTGLSPGSTTTISGIGGGYAMAYAYISGGSGLGTSNTSSSSTSATLSNPPSYSDTPRIIATSSSGSLNLATVASTASGGGPTWATGSGFAHPLDATLTAAVWVGTGSWTTTATPTLTSNSFNIWYVTGITSFS